MSKKNRQGHRAHRQRSVDFDYEDFSVQEKRNQEDSNNHSSQKNFQRKSQGRPPGLKGKAIGLYYRDLSRKKKEERGENQSSSRSSGQDRRFFSLPDSTDQTIRRLLMEALEATKSSSDGDNLSMQNRQFRKKFFEIVSGNIQDSLEWAMRMNSVLVNNDTLNNRLKKELEAKKEERAYQQMMTFRYKLPAYKQRNEIIKLMEKHQVILISGETGCGKTTQVCQYILDDAIEKGIGSTVKIVCTQPRRISATSVAERVAAERIENLGDSVGYQIRLEKALCRDYGSILFCTTGVLLRFMQSDPALRDYSHIILDEIHERNSETDFIMTILKQVIHKRSDLKVILMSATLNEKRFSEYYGDCPLIHIPGFTYEVTEYYLEDILKLTKFRFDTAKKVLPTDLTTSHAKVILPSLDKLIREGNYPTYVVHELRNPMVELINLELIRNLIEYICNNKGPGAILVFLPGLRDITQLCELLEESGHFPSNKFDVYPLHSQLPTADQKMIFNPPPVGVRKIIIATSIAETSITIEDVVYVIDCGQMKLSRFDIGLSLEMLKPEWETLANAKQRRGRAGRVQPGECYRLYTRAREATFDEYQTPEMIRTPLERVVLQIKLLQLGRADVFLANVLDPPEEKAIKLAIDLLIDTNALDEDENLTPLGYHLAQLPVDVKTGKMILWASIFSCVEPVFAIAACLSYKDPFYCPRSQKEEANKMKKILGLDQYSDHITFAEALRLFEKARRKSRKNARLFCSKYFLSFNTLELLLKMKKEFAMYMYDMQFLKSANPRDKESNINSRNLSLIKAIICAALCPNVAIVQKQARFPILATPEDGTVKIHPKSINMEAKALPTPYVTFFEKKKSTAIYLHDTTCVTDAALIFAFSNGQLKKLEKRSLLTLRQGFEFLCKQSVGETVKRLQENFNELLAEKFLNPNSINWNSSEGFVLLAIIEFLSVADTNVGITSKRLELESISEDDDDDDKDDDDDDDNTSGSLVIV
ncbi:ATP-dependent DNA/RNA helicase DHX36 [Chelonus insularis]|uniref:ATP-dependent DNA/RNA helicase DHX36 n=1 Tax=Chelonus insularis TaxID=460826 RepID=UPI0015890628|nr:ATP-dependent DNA/RNA helicase DHX36 [Chelonus insularis]